MDDWNWREHVQPSAFAERVGELQWANEDHMEEESEHSTSTDERWHNWARRRGVRYLENGRLREYVEDGQVEHQRYIWRRNPPMDGYPWYWERQWDEGWQEGESGDGAVFNVNSKGTETPGWWTSPQGEQYGYLGEDWAPANDV